MAKVSADANILRSAPFAFVFDKQTKLMKGSPHALKGGPRYTKICLQHTTPLIPRTIFAAVSAYVRLFRGFEANQDRLPKHNSKFEQLKTNYDRQRRRCRCCFGFGHYNAC